MIPQPVVRRHGGPAGPVRVADTHRHPRCRALAMHGLAAGLVALRLLAGQPLLAAPPGDGRPSAEHSAVRPAPTDGRLPRPRRKERRVPNTPEAQASGGGQDSSAPSGPGPPPAPP